MTKGTQMFARYTTVRGDPSKIDAAIDYVDGQARAAVEGTEGNLGFAVVADAERGRIVGASYWDSAESMRAAETNLADIRAATADVLGGEVSMERFEVALGFRHSFPARGATVRLARLELDPARAEEAISLMREENMPRVKGTDGLCSWQLLLNRESGSGMVVTAWESQEAAEAFWPTAQQLRARAADRVGARFAAPDDMTMVRSTVRLD
jgi:heme-degrading monooxygenase HmoA